MEPSGWIVGLATGACAIALAAAPAVRAAQSDALVETTIGMEGVYWLRTAHAAIQSAPVDDSAPVVLRIAQATGDGNATLYEVRYIGMIAGVHDLREYLRGPDGRIPQGIDRIPVKVRSVLPEDHDGQLGEFAPLQLAVPWPYRLMLGAAVLVWAARPAWLLVRRLTRRRAPVAPAAAAGPTLADQILPLVEAALTCGLSEADRARLELLLVAHWRRRLGLDGLRTLEALACMREDAEAGRLLRGLEGWLYKPPGRHSVNVEELLAPYRGSPPLAHSGVGSAVRGPAGGHSVTFGHPQLLWLLVLPALLAIWECARRGPLVTLPLDYGRQRAGTWLCG